MYLKQKNQTPGQDNSGTGTPTTTPSSSIEVSSATQIASSFLAALTQFSASGFDLGSSADGQAQSGAASTDLASTLAAAGQTSDTVPGSSDEMQTLLAELSQALSGSSNTATAAQPTNAEGTSSGTVSGTAHHHHGGHHHGAPPATSQTSASSSSSSSDVLAGTSETSDPEAASSILG